MKVTMTSEKTVDWLHKVLTKVQADFVLQNYELIDKKEVVHVTAQSKCPKCGSTPCESEHGIADIEGDEEENRLMICDQHCLNNKCEFAWLEVMACVRVLDINDYKFVEKESKWKSKKE